MIYTVSRVFSLAAVLVFTNALGFGQKTAPAEEHDLPVVRHFLAPEYPFFAWLAQVEGTVVTELTITRDGTVDSANVVSGLPIFQKSIETAQAWTFRVADSTKINITTEFKLDCAWTAASVNNKRGTHSRIETQVSADLPAKLEIRACPPTIETTVAQSQRR